MKAQEGNKGEQGRPTSDRTFFDHSTAMKSRGVSIGGGQRSEQTSNRDNDRKVANRRRSLL
ncbi:MAG TPA: hypothetical protein VHS53_10860 [Mucilaginibacter sp.]|jgi:hypothetical protein|nr:hypothetical protein [Mucilaginibacter sp.]